MFTWCFADAIWDYGNGSLVVVGENATAGIFATYPSKHLTLLNGFFDQVRQQNVAFIEDIFKNVPVLFVHTMKVLIWTPLTFIVMEKTVETSSEYQRFRTILRWIIVRWTNQYFSQMIGTAALIVCILAIVDPYNNPIPQGLEAFTVGFVVLVIGQSMGFNSGYAVNPARDLGPRIFTALAGWGSEVFSWVTFSLLYTFLPSILALISSLTSMFVPSTTEQTLTGPLYPSLPHSLVPCLVWWCISWW